MDKTGTTNENTQSTFMPKYICILIIGALVAITGCVEDKPEFSNSTLKAHLNNTGIAYHNYENASKEFNAGLAELDAAAYEYNKTKQ